MYGDVYAKRPRGHTSPEQELRRRRPSRSQWPDPGGPRGHTSPEQELRPHGLPTARKARGSPRGHTSPEQELRPREGGRARGPISWTPRPYFTRTRIETSQSRADGDHGPRCPEAILHQNKN